MLGVALVASVSGTAQATTGDRLAAACLQLIRDGHHTLTVDPRECTDAIESGDLSDETMALVLYARGAIRMQRGHPKSGARDFAQAAALNPDPSFVRFMGGMMRLVADDPASAVIEWTSALKIRENPTIRLERGKALLLLGQPAEAIEDFNHVLEAWPLSAEAWVGRGSAQLGAGRPEAALTDLNRVLDKRPEHVEALKARAAALFDKGDAMSAKIDAARAAKIHPHNALLSAKLAFAGGDWQAMNLELRKADPYLSLAERRHIYIWSAIAERRHSGKPGVGGLPMVFDPAQANVWPMPAMRFVIRAQYPRKEYFERFTAISEAQVFAAAKDDDPRVADAQRVQAAFYVGQIYLGIDKPAEATRVFRQIADAAQFDSWEYRVTLVELARLGKPKK
ncbi:MAG TPA: tetratricopeptide repeat protein [Vineibacter sp.]|nr:tetratricopeptide repeat protein [Vineibacter sp.]